MFNLRNIVFNKSNSAIIGLAVSIFVAVACGGGSSAVQSPEADTSKATLPAKTGPSPTPVPTPTVISEPVGDELPMKEELLTVVQNHQEMFWKESIDFKGLYNSKTGICQSTESLLEFITTISFIKDFVFDITGLQQEDVNEGESRVELIYFNPPVAYLETSLYIDGEIAFDPDLALWLLEDGQWAIHDCNETLVSDAYLRYDTWITKDDIEITALAGNDVKLADELLAVEKARDNAFILDDIDASILYESYSMSCRRITPFYEYSAALKSIKEWLADVMGIKPEQFGELQDVTKIVHFEPPIAYVFTGDATLNGKPIPIEPSVALYVLEDGTWRYLDCL